MSKKTNKDEALEDKLEPLLDSAMKKYLGITISEIKGDISDKIKHSPLLGLSIEYNLPFKEAKQKFKRDFLQKLLQKHYGNISKVSRLTGMNRRSIHRIVNKDKTEKIRKTLPQPYKLKKREVEDIIEGVADTYKGYINDDKFNKFYKATPEISKDIVEEIPEKEVTLKEAEAEFEKKYLKRKLKENNHNIKRTASSIRLNYETLVRKMRQLGLKLVSDKRKL